MIRPTKTQKTNFLAFAVVAAAWLLIFAAGYPRPHIDDLFFTGAGISLAEGNGLRNPWLAPWLEQFATDKFYVQTTFYPWLLALWLSLFGVSAKAILGLQCLIGAVGCGFFLILLRRSGFSAGMMIVAFIIYTTFILSFGLRPEPFGIACVLGALLCWQGEKHTLWLLGCFLGACAPLFTPFLFALVVPLGLGWLLGFYESPRSYGKLGRKVLFAISGAGAAFALLVFSVNCELGEYLRIMSEHAAKRVPAASEKLKVFVGNFMVGYEPIFRIPAVLLPWGVFGLLVVFLRKRFPGELHSMALVMTGFFLFFVLAVSSYSQQTVRYLPMLSLVVAGVLVCSIQPSRLGLLLRRVWVFVALFAMVPVLAFEIFAFSRFRDHDAKEVRAVVNAVDNSGSRLLLDEFGIRYFYDFRPPGGSTDWMLGRGHYGAHTTYLRSKPSGVSWLVDKRKLRTYVPDSGVELDGPQLFGRRFGGFGSNQFQVVYIP